MTDSKGHLISDERLECLLKEKLDEVLRRNRIDTTETAQFYVWNLLLNPTVAEILRIYLNDDDHVKMTAWRKEHYSKPLLFRIETDGKSAKKALSDAISRLQKDLDKYGDEFKKAVK